MRYLLDSNVLIALQKQNPNLLKKMYCYPTDMFVVSSIVYFELMFGAYNSQQIQKNIQKIKALPFEILPFNEFDAEQAGNIRHTLAQRGVPIGVYDTLIAGQALANDLIVITRNVREFERVDGLKVENWLD